MGKVKQKWFEIGFKEGYNQALQTFGGLLHPVKFKDIGEDEKYDTIEAEKGFKEALTQWIRDKLNPKSNFEEYMKLYLNHINPENYFYK